VATGLQSTVCLVRDRPRRPFHSAAITRPVIPFGERPTELMKGIAVEPTTEQMRPLATPSNLRRTRRMEAPSVRGPRHPREKLHVEDIVPGPRRPPKK